MEGNRGEAIRNMPSVFAQDLVTFGFREHGYFCFLAIPLELWNNKVEIFHRDVGKVVMSYAKSSQIHYLLSLVEDEARENMRDLTTFALWMTLFRNWCFLMFFSCDFSLTTVLKYFACVIELTVFARSLGMRQTENIAVREIVGHIMGNDFQTHVRGGLRELVTTAKDLYRRNSLLVRDGYETGRLFWRGLLKYVQNTPVNPGVQSSGPVNPGVQSSGPFNTGVLPTGTFYPEAQSKVRDNAVDQPLATYNMAQLLATYSHMAYPSGMFSPVMQPAATLNSVLPPTVPVNPWQHAFDRSPQPTVQADPVPTYLLPVTSECTIL